MQRNTLTKCVGSFTVYIFWQVLSLPVSGRVQWAACGQRLGHRQLEIVHGVITWMAGRDEAIVPY